MKMKKVFSAAALAVMLIGSYPHQAQAYYCSNCSTWLQQALEYAAQVEELAEMVTQTQQAIKQTEMQIMTPVTGACNVLVQIFSHAYSGKRSWFRRLRSWKQR